MDRLKGQYALEYLIVFAFSVILLLPGLVFMYNNYDSMKYSFDTHQAYKAINKISETATEVYYSGNGSMATIIVSLPTTISASSIEGKELNINISAKAGYTNVVVVSMVPMYGNLPSRGGLHKINITSMGDSVSIN